MSAYSIEMPLKAQGPKEREPFADHEGIDGSSGVPKPCARLIGESSPIRHIRRKLDTIAQTGRTTLLSGPTGSGKEVVARQLHQISERHTRPFVTVHCGALPEQLIESELFGHARGAFTGATQHRNGLIRTARRGTLFLDEVNSLPFSAQSRLLRFLESREFRSVGTDRTERSEAWVIAATNENLETAVADGRFRADLLYRLQVVCLDMPSLNERGGDVLLLADHFLERVSRGGKSFSDNARRAMLRHSWPGNVRELKHRVESAALLTEDAVIDAEALGFGATPAEDRGQAPLEGRSLARQLWGLIADSQMTLAEAISFCEEMIIHEALQAERENRTRAAERLGIHVRTIFKKLSNQRD